MPISGSGSGIIDSNVKLLKLTQSANIIKVTACQEGFAADQGESISIFSFNFFGQCASLVLQTRSPNTTRYKLPLLRPTDAKYLVRSKCWTGDGRGETEIVVDLRNEMSKSGLLEFTSRSFILPSQLKYQGLIIYVLVSTFVSLQGL